MNKFIKSICGICFCFFMIISVVYVSSPVFATNEYSLDGNISGWEYIEDANNNSILLTKFVGPIVDNTIIIPNSSDFAIFNPAFSNRKVRIGGWVLLSQVLRRAEKVVISYTGNGVISIVSPMKRITDGVGNLKYLDLERLDVVASGFKSLNSAFSYNNLETLKISSWDVSNITDFSEMFINASNLTSVDLSKWNTSSVTTMFMAFSQCPKLQSLDLTNWNVSKVTDFSNMFAGSRELTTVGDLSNWNVSSAESLAGMFNNALKLSFVGNLDNWDVSKVKYLSRMFSNVPSLNGIGTLSNWKLDNALSINGMFRYAKSIDKLDLSGWNVSKVTDLSELFEGAESLESVGDISNWDVSKVTNMSNLFSCASDSCKKYSLKNVDLSNWNVENVERIYGIFSSAYSLESIGDLTNWSLPNLKQDNYWSNNYQNQKTTFGFMYGLNKIHTLKAFNANTPFPNESRYLFSSWNSRNPLLLITDNEYLASLDPVLDDNPDNSDKPFRNRQPHIYLHRPDGNLFKMGGSVVVKPGDFEVIKNKNIELFRQILNDDNHPYNILFKKYDYILEELDTLDYGPAFQAMDLLLKMTKEDTDYVYGPMYDYVNSLKLLGFGHFIPRKLPIITPVLDVDHLTDSEKDSVINEIKTANKHFPAASNIIVSDNGEVLIVFPVPDGSPDGTNPERVIFYQGETVKYLINEPVKTLVDNLSKITDSEKEKVIKEIKTANKHFPENTDILVDDDGTAHIVFKNGMGGRLLPNQTIALKSPVVNDNDGGDDSYDFNYDYSIPKLPSTGVEYEGFVFLGGSLLLIGIYLVILKLK